MKSSEYESAAVLTIKYAGRMRRKERERIAEWLRLQAVAFETEGDQYSDLFRARYLIPK